MILHFTAHTINCVCQSIRSMFRVLGIYNFDVGIIQGLESFLNPRVSNGKFSIWAFDLMKASLGKMTKLFLTKFGIYHLFKSWGAFSALDWPHPWRNIVTDCTQLFEFLALCTAEQRSAPICVLRCSSDQLATASATFTITNGALSSMRS